MFDLALPDADADPREQVSELAPRGALIPSAATPALALGTLVQRDALALPVGVEAQFERARAVRECLHREVAGAYATAHRVWGLLGCLNRTVAKIVAGVV